MYHFKGPYFVVLQIFQGSLYLSPPSSFLYFITKGTTFNATLELQLGGRGQAALALFQFLPTYLDVRSQILHAMHPCCALLWRTMDVRGTEELGMGPSGPGSQYRPWTLPILQF